jgi:hypothetical protein
VDVGPEKRIEFHAGKWECDEYIAIPAHPVSFLLIFHCSMGTCAGKSLASAALVFDFVRPEILESSFDFLSFSIVETLYIEFFFHKWVRKRRMEFQGRVSCVPLQARGCVVSYVEGSQEIENGNPGLCTPAEQVNAWMLDPSNL